MTQPHTPDPARGPQNEKPTTAHERLIGEALAEFIDLRAQGKNVDPERFLSLRPELAPELTIELQTVSEIDRILSGADEPQSVQAIPDDLPEHLSGHRILGIIGSGGMGRVLLAMDEGLGRKVAIKTLSPRFMNDTRVRTRFMQEARALARVNHPNVVRIYNLGQPEEIPHFVMEYVEGAPLTDAARVLSISQRAELMHKVVLAVDQLHRNQIVHRDLKPANILAGSDLEPKLLDFGLAQQVDEKGNRITQAGQVMGTPDYFSPEQARADPALDARSDIFSLGIILYEMLTGVVPFRAENYPDQVRMICEQDPVLPRRIDSAIPGALQNICLKCLEKRPDSRYGTARELADDLERLLAGEPVLASPTHYSRLMSGKIEQHLRELGGWRQDRMLSEYEYDAFRKLYERLFEKEDAWILEVRRLSLTQVTLYLGAWILVVAAVLVLLFRYPGLSGTTAVLVVGAATAPMAWIGIHCWRQGQLRIAIAYLLAFCLLLPTLMLVAMKEWHILTQFSHGKESLELFAKFPSFQDSKQGAPFSGTTNAQMWWSFLLSLPAYLWLRRFTKSSVFSLMLAVVGALLCIVTLLRMGMIEWFDTDPGKVYFRLIPFAALYFFSAACIERLHFPSDSRYFYPIAVLFTFIALSGVAGFHKPYAEWLERVFPWTRGQLEYLFIINAGIYLALQSISERFGSAQMRWVAKSFRFVIPGHVLTSILLLGLAATDRWNEALQDSLRRHEARLFEILLPVAACLFVFGSVPKQMKNFFATGLIFLAIGITRLQMQLFKERISWPVSLLIMGVILMMLAANYTPIKLAIIRRFRRK
ncbi:MAG TPA: serine/threonine-protein kinase [Acidobacteriota bacterium]|nr:serine/threonine-protein kinase [Acidobacteriota bacterium]